MFVLDRLVAMFVAVRFTQVQHDAGEHQRTADGHRRTRDAIAEHHRQRSADEGSEGEDGAGARGPEGTLRQQVQAQAQAIAGRAHQEQAQRLPRRRQRLARSQRQQQRRAGAEDRLGHHDLARVALGQRP